MATWMILGGLALIVVIAALIALNRSWGNFPERADTLPPTGASAPGMSSSTGSSAAESWEDRRQLGTPAQPVAAIEVASQPGWLVPIEDPLVRRTAEQALEKGGPITRYIVRQGGQVCFDFSQIDDPARRQEAYDLMRRFNAGQDVDIAAMVKMINRLFKP
ncbi:MAG TPA: hypothetical protein VKE41_01985 [Roseiflexaceae bacterium]|nr:hypothetical protein [Roseiflexaceae bacterium]